MEIHIPRIVICLVGNSGVRFRGPGSCVLDMADVAGLVLRNCSVGVRISSKLWYLL